MKEYDRDKKMWVKPETLTEKVTVLKKSELCRGKKPHEYVLIVPDYSNSHKNDDLSQETVDRFYALMDEHHEHNKKYQKEVDALGINYRVDSLRPMTRMSRCNVCGKRDWGF